ncbi:MAG TPA: TIGR00269 family protein [Candidatus Bathyarchaeota archaeon]|nr:TIGR00269 family protein [Candidatus Bathyarchaeota archaeon]HEX69435.1 TIGR00269 family protein [Candidatus Bathyarchaeota archaeon]
MPIKCNKCHSAPAEIRLEYARLNLCPDCFKEYYVNRVRRTVEEYKMFSSKARVGVAVSGGKDSMALLHSLKNAFPAAEFVALHVDLGIEGYSRHCKEKVEELVETLSVELEVFSLKDELGFSIDDFKKTIYRRKMCSACGTVKRHLFEVLAERAKTKVLATGHNLDDVVAVMLNNFFNGNWSQLVRLKPVLEPLVPNQTFKVKPLIKTPEKENLLYCLYADVPFREVNCPYAHMERLRRNREMLEYLSKDNPAFRHQMLKNFLRLIPILEKTVEKPKLTKCEICGYPSSAEVCAFCKRVGIVKRALEAPEEA